jgi:membrane associated rhomboid family serine protease
MIPIKDSHPASRFPFWTVLIIALNVYVFFLEMTTPDQQAFINQYALIPSLIDPSNYNTFLPFITSQFLHGGFLHIISNMLFLWVFGDNVEDRLGFFFFPIFYLLSGAIGGLAQFALDPTSTIPMIGASGAVAGVLGAYFALFPHHKVKTLVPILGLFTFIDIPASFMLIYWFVTQLFSGAGSLALSSSQDVGGIAYFAHIGGFVFGWLVATMTASSPKQLATI